MDADAQNRLSGEDVSNDARVTGELGTGRRKPRRRVVGDIGFVVEDPIAVRGLDEQARRPEDHVPFFVYPVQDVLKRIAKKENVPSRG